MICSAPTGKSGSNWLDRLRSNKGIPTGDNLDLDSFLLTTTTTTTTITQSHSQTRPHLTRTRTRSPETHHQSPPISTVLSELFNVGATLTQTSKKCPRKQTNPKFFLASSSSSSSTNNTVPATEAKEEEEEEEEKEGEEEETMDPDENDEDGHELKGFSRSEVTVIDTSCSGWKVDKFVFRKNSVWKVRERKPKFKSFAKKKSREILLAPGLDTNVIGTSK